jgi:hypothetical protein
MLSLFFAQYYLEKKSRVISLAALLFLAFGIFWNPEFGIMTFLAFVIFLCYVELGKSNIMVGIKHCAGHLVAAAVTLFLSAALYSIYIRVAFGSFPDLLELFSTLNVFSIIGFNMLDTPLLHPWNLFAVIYLFGLLYVVAAVVNRVVTEMHAKVFLVIMLGVGSLFYYLGRSHNWNLMVTSVYAFLLLGICADSLLVMIRKVQVFIVPLMIIMFVLGSSLFQVAFIYGDVRRLFSESESKIRYAAENEMIVADADFIRQNCQVNEKVLILVAEPYQGLYHGLSNTASDFNPGLIDLFLRSDYDRLLSWLSANSQTKVFFNRDNFSPFDGRVNSILSSLYHVEKYNGRIALLVKNQSN